MEKSLIVVDFSILGLAQQERNGTSQASVALLLVLRHVAQRETVLPKPA